MSDLMSQMQADRLMMDARKRTESSENLLREFRIFSKIVMFLLSGIWTSVLVMFITRSN